MISANKSLWEDEFYLDHYDLVVIGAGLVGQSVAHFYKEQHPEASILVLERGAHPIGASSRNAGFTCIGSITEHLADLEIESEEKLRNTIKKRYEGLFLMRSILGDDYIEYNESGGIEIFTDSAKFEETKAAIPMLNEWLFEITGESDVYDANTYLGIPAIYNKIEGMINSGKMLKRIQDLNRQKDIHYRWNSKVVSIEAGIKLEDGSKIKSKRVALATNAFTSELIKDIEIKPGRGYVFTTKPLGNLEWMGTFHYNKGYVYFRNIDDERLLIGGGRDQDFEGESTSEFGVNQKIKDYLINFANDVLELPTNWKIDQEWSGIMGFTSDHQPIVQKYNENIVLACGLNGMGVAIGMQVGKEAAELLTD